MSEHTRRWDAFTSIELTALEELLRNFGPLRSYNPAIAEITREIAATMERRNIAPFGPVDPQPKRTNPDRQL